VNILQFSYKFKKSLLTLYKKLFYACDRQFRVMRVLLTYNTIMFPNCHFYNLLLYFSITIWLSPKEHGFSWPCLAWPGCVSACSVSHDRVSPGHEMYHLTVFRLFVSSLAVLNWLYPSWLCLTWSCIAWPCLDLPCLALMCID